MTIVHSSYFKPQTSAEFAGGIIKRCHETNPLESDKKALQNISRIMSLYNAGYGRNPIVLESFKDITDARKFMEPSTFQARITLLSCQSTPSNSDINSKALRISTSFRRQLFPPLQEVPLQEVKRRTPLDKLDKLDKLDQVVISAHGSPFPTLEGVD